MLPARLLRRPTELPRQVKHVSHQRATANLELPNLRILAVLRTQHPQPLTIRPIPRIKKVAEHVVALDPGLKNGPKGRLRLVLVEALLHVLDRSLRVDFVSARYTIHGGHLRLLLVVVVHVGVDGGAFSPVDDGVELPVSAVELLEDLLHFELLLPDLVEGFDVGLLGGAGAEGPLLDALGQNLEDSVGGQFEAALVGAVFRAVAGAAGTRGAVALARVVGLEVGVGRAVALRARVTPLAPPTETKLLKTNQFV